jgi:hypothetical protein
MSFGSFQVMEIILLLVYNCAMFSKSIDKFLNKIGDKTRRVLSNYPILYAFIGGSGIVLFWRGIWHIADDVSLGSGASLIIGALILIVTGLFVSEFIGNRLIISGLIGEQEMEKKEEGQIETEETQIKNLQNTLTRLEKKLEHIDREVEEGNGKSKAS